MANTVALKRRRESQLDRGRCTFDRQNEQESHFLIYSYRTHVSVGRLIKSFSQSSFGFISFRSVTPRFLLFQTLKSKPDPR